MPDILEELGCSLAVSTYQSGKVILISNNGQGGIRQLPRAFDVPMGLAVRDKQMAIATRDQVIVLTNDPRLAANYPRQPGIYDALFAPRAVYLTNVLDIHDLVWADEGLLAVATAFSCLARIETSHSFTPVWRPPFVSELRPEDRCHLNGVALLEGQPRYVTCLGTGDTPESWRDNRLSGGAVVDVASGEVVVGGLALPHSPRLIDGSLFVLNSGNAELLRVDTDRGAAEHVARLPGFARGMAQCGDYLFIGLSQLREGHKAFGDLAIAAVDASYCGLVVVHLPTGSLAAELRYLRSCKEIYDVQVLPQISTPGLLGLGNDAYRAALSTPEFAGWIQG